MSKQVIYLRNLYTKLCAVGFKTFLFTLGYLLYFRLFHLIFGSNPVYLAFYCGLFRVILFLSQIQLQKLFIHLLDFISHRMPPAEFFQRTIRPMLFSQQCPPAIVRLMLPSVKSIRNPLSAISAFCLQPLAICL